MSGLEPVSNGWPHGPTLSERGGESTGSDPGILVGAVCINAGPIHSAMRIRACTKREAKGLVLSVARNPDGTHRLSLFRVL